MTELTHRLWMESAIGKELTDAEARELLLLSRRENYRAGEALFREGDEAVEFFLIVEGEIDVVKATEGGRTSILATLSHGSILGEMSLLTHERRSASAVAKSDATVLRVRWEDFQHLLRDDPAAAYKLVFALARLLALRLKRINLKVAELTTQSPEPDHKLEEFAAFKQKLLSDWSF